MKTEPPKMNYAMRVMMKMTPTCQDITAKISESLDHPVSCPDKIRIRIHLITCSACRRYRDQLVQITNLVSRLSDETGYQLGDEAKEKIKSTLENESSAGAD